MHFTNKFHILLSFGTNPNVSANVFWKIQQVYLEHFKSDNMNTECVN